MQFYVIKRSLSEPISGSAVRLATDCDTGAARKSRREKQTTKRHDW